MAAETLSIYVVVNHRGSPADAGARFTGAGGVVRSAISRGVVGEVAGIVDWERLAEADAVEVDDGGGPVGDVDGEPELVHGASRWSARSGDALA